MIDTVLYKHILDNIFTGVVQGHFVYASAEKLSAPYIIMNKVTDLEQPRFLCDTQGEVGEALFQFTAYAGGPAHATNALNHIVYLQEFKELVKNVRGVIGTTEQYRLHANFTTGVRTLSDGANSLNTWGAFFESTIQWEAI